MAVYFRQNKAVLFKKRKLFGRAAFFGFSGFLGNLVVKDFSANFFLPADKLTAQGLCKGNYTSFVELCGENPLRGGNPNVYNDLMKGKKAASMQIVPVYASL